MKKFMLLGLVLVVIIAVVVYSMIFQKEVDDVAENGPIQSQIISKIDQIPLF